MDVWVCLKRKEKECRIERTVENQSVQSLKRYTEVVWRRGMYG